MSSHYIIRENQEPGLLIVEADAVDFHIIEGLLEWSPHLLVMEKNIPFFLEKNIKMDAVIVDNPELNWKSLFTFHWPVEILKADDYPNSVITHLSSRNMVELSIVEKFESMGISEMSTFQDYLQCVVVYSGHLKFHFSRNGRFEKWISPGRGIVIPQFCRKSFWISDNLQRVEGDRFEVVQEGIVCVRSKFDFWIGENVI